MTTAVFAIAACAAIVCALAVVRTGDLVHAVLWLAGALVATAVIYATLGASFLAGTQLLLYVGGVVTLMVFGVMITRRHDGIHVAAERTGDGRAMAVALGLFVTTAVAIHRTPGLESATLAPAPLSPESLGHLLLGEHVLAFEVLSMLLLAATVGAIVVSRRRDAAFESPPSLPTPTERGPSAPQVHP